MTAGLLGGRQETLSIQLYIGQIGPSLGQRPTGCSFLLHGGQPEEPTIRSHDILSLFVVGHHTSSSCLSSLTSVARVCVETVYKINMANTVPPPSQRA